MSKDVRILLKSVSDLTGITRLARAVRDHIPGVKALETAYKGVAAGLRVVGDVGGRALRGLRNGTLAVTGATIGAVREFASFNVGMARAWTMMDTGIEGFKEMRKQIIDMAADLGVAKDQLTTGLYQALSAGVPKDNVLAFLRTAAQVSIADGSDIATAVDGITTVLNSFGISADRTEEVTDKLFKTVANGKTTFGQLAASISQAAPVAASMGVDLDQLLAAVATLTKQGVPTATAMVQIRNALTIVNDELGDGWANAQTFQEALQGIAAASGHSQAALANTFGSQTMAAVSALTGANFSNAQADLASMAASSGSLAGAFSKMESETSHWPRLWQTIRSTITNLGEDIEIRIRPAVRAVQDMLNKFRQSDAFKNFSEGFGEAVSNFLTNLTAGIVTAAQLAKASFSEGATAIGATLKTVLIEGFTIAGTVLIEFLRANLEVFLTMGRLIGQAITTELLKTDLPGIAGIRRNAARKTMQSVSPAELKDAGIDIGLSGNKPMDNTSAYNLSRNLSTEILAQLATFTRGNDFEESIARSRANFAASGGRIADQFGRSRDNISSTFQNAVGIDPRELYTANREAIQSFTRPGESPSAPGQAPEDRRAHLRSILEQRQAMLELDRANHDIMGVSAGGTLRKRNTEDMAKVVEALNALEEDRMDDINRLLAAYDSLARKYEDQRRIIRNLPL